MATATSQGLLRLMDSDVRTAVFKNLAVGVVVCDNGGHFLFFSPEAERIQSEPCLPVPRRL